MNIVTAAARRPIAARRSRWAAWGADALGRAGVEPNYISVASVVFAAGAAGALLLTGQAAGYTRAPLFLGAALLVQARLLCNLLDGMVAIEGSKGSPSGEVYNDLPDRLSDGLILVSLGYTTTLPGAHELGWLAALLATLTAYIRTLGGAAGLQQDFRGPMAKQQRMATVTAACLLCTPLVGTNWPAWIAVAALVMIVAGSAMTTVRRTRRIVRALEDA